MLGDDAIARYARQIVIPGIGAAGQEKLLASTVLVAGNARGREQAALYLRAAGVRVVEWTGAANVTFDLAVVAGAEALDVAARDTLVASGRPLCWYTTDQGGFTSGVHPAAPLPAPRTDEGAADSQPEVHDAAACDTASLACAVLLGLPHRRRECGFEIA